MNKKGATVQQIFIASILFITMFVGMIITYGEFIVEYDLTPNDLYFGNESPDESSIAQAYNISKDITSKFQESKGDQSNLDTSIVGGLNSIKLALKMFDLVKKIINHIAIVLSIPIWIVNAALFGILITITLAVVAAFLGRRTD